MFIYTLLIAWIVYEVFGFETPIFDGIYFDGYLINYYIFVIFVALKGFNKVKLPYFLWLPCVCLN